MPLKTTKDNNAPKKPLTAYMLFSADERPKLKATGLDNFAEMNKALGSAWKQADANIKARYEKAHERDKTRYESELKDYQTSGAPAPSSKSAQKSKPSVVTTESTSKKEIPAVKNDKPASDDDNDEEEDDDDKEEESEEGSEEVSEEEEEEEKSAPPVKNSRKKI